METQKQFYDMPDLPIVHVKKLHNNTVSEKLSPIQKLFIDDNEAETEESVKLNLINAVQKANDFYKKKIKKIQVEYKVHTKNLLSRQPDDIWTIYTVHIE